MCMCMCVCVSAFHSWVCKMCKQHYYILPASLAISLLTPPSCCNVNTLASCALGITSSTAPPRARPVTTAPNSVSPAPLTLTMSFSSSSAAAGNSRKYTPPISPSDVNARESIYGAESGLVSRASPGRNSCVRSTPSRPSFVSTHGMNGSSWMLCCGIP